MNEKSSRDKTSSVIKEKTPRNVIEKTAHGSTSNKRNDYDLNYHPNGLNGNVPSEVVTGAS